MKSTNRTSRNNSRNSTARPNKKVTNSNNTNTETKVIFKRGFSEQTIKRVKNSVNEEKVILESFARAARIQQLEEKLAIIKKAKKEKKPSRFVAIGRDFTKNLAMRKDLMVIPVNN